ncbi:MAG: adenosylcobinamide-phosphate synthase CbiB [Deltaproteobacteria bacterium]|jgi:adenosylcobinamide-phosphate synthase|nr:adenosylcobinamide-phosphate synthase CbiB [Deltaproteobacteria bacterium]
MPPLITVIAYILDSLIGDPQTWPHPVRYIGKAIDLLEALIRKTLARIKKETPVFFIIAGGLMYILVVGLSALVVILALHYTKSLSLVLYLVVAVYLVFASICLRDLLNHTAKVEERLAADDIDGARARLSWIVGRDTLPLDTQAIRRAEIETLSENFSDGLVAPLFYLGLGGPVLAWIYKATNTLDSMVGYQNEKFLYLGRISARADDVLNFIPSRLAALILVLAAKILGRDYKNSYSLWRREGSHHSSPNSGQTEAAMAGALGIFLGGTYSYQGVVYPKPKLNDGGRESTYGDVKACEDMVRVGTILILILAIVMESIALAIFGSSNILWG